jgi:hypothetical protein
MVSGAEFPVKLDTESRERVAGRQLSIIDPAFTPESRRPRDAEIEE